MKIHVNGTEQQVADGCTLATLVAPRPGLAAAINGEVVRDWERTLRDGDAVEVLTAMQGG